LLRHEECTIVGPNLLELLMKRLSELAYFNPAFGLTRSESALKVLVLPDAQRQIRSLISDPFVDRR
jgi:hypothetical protein